MADKEQIMKLLGEVEDPELRRPLTDLDMVKTVDINGDRVRVEILLTIPGCPLKKKITDDITAKLKTLPDIREVQVDFGVMSDEQRKNLRVKLYGASAKPADGSTPVAGDFAARVIAVASGKGGVGKSTVTANLASALSTLGFKVGVLDADVYGFSIPRILGVKGQPTIIDEQIIPLRRNNIQVMSIGFFIDEEQPVVWRGPLLHKTINQFISDVLWDKLDFFLIDLPPGTGDVSITISQALPKAELLVITTPQPVASHTAGRVARMAEKTNLKVLGVVENMSYYEVNGTRDYIFGKGGGMTLAETLQVPFFGEIPILTEIRERADAGNPAPLDEKSSISEYYLEIARKIVARKA